MSAIEDTPINHDLEQLKATLEIVGISDLERHIVGKAILDITSGKSPTFPRSVLGRDQEGNPTNALGATLISEFNPQTSSLDEGFPFEDEKFDLVIIPDGSYMDLYEEDIIDLFRIIKVDGELRIALDQGEAPGGGLPEDHFRYSLDRDCVNATVVGVRDEASGRQPYLIATRVKDRTV